MTSLDKLKKIVSAFPQCPGVYLMKNSQDEILYIGKASQLRSRVKSYFSKEIYSRYQISFLMKKVAKIETIVTDSVKEALLLENTLIKTHRPRYNINLKDDKSYVSIKLDIKHSAPRLYVTRKIRRDGNLYFGPYTSAATCRDLVDFVETHFRLRNCSDHDYRNRVRPCIQYQIKRCDAPCVGLITIEEYQKIAEQVRLFLSGKHHELKEIISQQMKEAAKEQQFEQAARYRDLMISVDKTFEKQKVVRHDRTSQDVIAYYQDNEQLIISVLRIREGALQNSQNFVLKFYVSLEEAISSFIGQYYEEKAFIPREVLLPNALEDSNLLSTLLSERLGKQVILNVPKRGEKKALLSLAFKNAENYFEQNFLKQTTQKHILENLQKKIKLRHLPQRLECYDISNFQGKESIASMVTFIDGRPEKKFYRSFRIKHVQGANDFASIYEVICRRLKNAKAQKSYSEAWKLPDLIVIDGGKGQLNAAMQALKDEKKNEELDLISLAKSRVLSSEKRSEEQMRSQERVFLPGRMNPIILKENTPELRILTHARDEAHRFGIQAHRRLRQKKSLESPLQNIPGIGKFLQKKLLEKFGSLQAIKNASCEDLQQVRGITQKKAKEVLSFLTTS